ncbi:MAG: hypothetical protein OHK93_003699 [Ramalina farinacea]|uniref:Phosphoglycerate mutase n=1 Tax=Ramalina farinacea TaxID=258253 RepID=A0AA43QY81_9LECA|nr:hypothetical protein [Ramalina farinacea]
MSDQNAGTPRVFIARHGETEWTINGLCTGKSEIPLTANGRRQVQGTQDVLVGAGKLMDPAKFAHIFVSPRQRAQSTLDLLIGSEKERLQQADKITTTEDIAEWDYGNYEGLHPNDIRAYRKEKGLDKDKSWDIWVDGCEGGESAEDVRIRLDRLIKEINTLQEPFLSNGGAGDVLLV